MITIEYDFLEYPYIELKVKIVVPHPQYNPRTFENDLALLRFYEPVQHCTHFPTAFK